MAKNIFGLNCLSLAICDWLVEDFITDKPKDKKIDRFLDYLIKTFNSNAIFLPIIWAAPDACLTRMTNSCVTQSSIENQ